MDERKKILLVEDDVFISDIYREKLRNEGFEVILAENGFKALQKMEEAVPDLVLLDIILPQLDGLSVLRRIRATESWQNIPVIMMTNIAEKEKVEEVQKELVADYVVKSHFTPAEVVTKIRTLFERQNLV